VTAVNAAEHPPPARLQHDAERPGRVPPARPFLSPGPKPALDPLTSAEATLAICQPALRGVAEADYHKPTVCTEFDVTQLADHLIGSVTYFGAVALAGAGASAEPVTGPLETRVATAAQATLEAWYVRGLDRLIAFTGRTINQ
jgi:hypothetical protein